MPTDQPNFSEMTDSELKDHVLFQADGIKMDLEQLLDDIEQMEKLPDLSEDMIDFLRVLKPWYEQVLQKIEIG